MSLPPGQCCISGTAFNSACNGSASFGPAQPCGTTQTLDIACYKYVPCLCSNDVTSLGVSQAVSDAPTAHPSSTYADQNCCSWAKSGAFSASAGCTATTSDWEKVCEYKGGGNATKYYNFKNCQLSCKNNGYTAQGWSDTCAAAPSPPPPVPPPPSPPSPSPEPPPSGPGGDGYQLTLPSSWLIEHRKAIADGIKVCKVAVAMGRAVGLPLPGTSALPSEVVSKKELEAVDAVNTLMGEWNAVATGKAVATGQAYKMLRKVLDVQCNDKYLEHCSMQKVRAKDGTIEFVSEATKARFIERGRACLIWNTQAALAPS